MFEHIAIVMVSVCILTYTDIRIHAFVYTRMHTPIQSKIRNHSGHVAHVICSSDMSLSPEVLKVIIRKVTMG